ncbi:hypothetical protein Tco_0055465 [Tanacetum coccineum]
MKTPMSSDTKLTKDEVCESVDSTKYRGMIGCLLFLTASRPDIMFSVCLCARFQEAPKTYLLEAVKHMFRYIKGDYVDRKSTSGIYTFVGCCLTYWFSKKQTTLAISTTEAEYALQHSQTKHIEIRHHFLRDNVQKGHISIEKVSYVDNIADILTKPLKRESFNYLRLGLGMMEHIP